MQVHAGTQVQLCVQVSVQGQVRVQVQAGTQVQLQVQVSVQGQACVQVQVGPQVRQACRCRLLAAYTRVPVALLPNSSALAAPTHLWR